MARPHPTNWAKKAWGVWGHFNDLRGLLQFVREWWWLLALAIPSVSVVIAIVLAIVAYLLGWISGYWPVAVAVTAIVIVVASDALVIRWARRSNVSSQAVRPHPAHMSQQVAPVLVPEEQVMTNDDTSRQSLGTGLYFGVHWGGFRLPNGYLEADGPFCPRDDTALVFRTGAPDPSPIRDYQVVDPPNTALVCPACEREYYLDASEKESAHIGNCRSHAAWRLGGGMTKWEQMMKRMGL